MKHGGGAQRPSRTSAYSGADVAASYDRLLVRYHLAAPARDLVAMLKLSAGALVLDVGSGTGAAAAPAAEMVGPEGRVVAVEPSQTMLRILQQKAACRLVAGQAPGLPFRESLFDAVLATFVLSHFEIYESALDDMVRVLRPRGRLGVTAWGPGQTESMRVWKEVAGTFVSLEWLEQASRDHLPWEEWFKDETHLQRALEEASLSGVEVRRREYRVTISLTEYLALREAGIEGRLLRQALRPERWDTFRQRALAVFRSRFTEPIEYSRQILLACGTKPSIEAPAARA